MNRWFTTADENAATGGMTGFVGAFSLEACDGFANLARDATQTGGSRAAV